MLHTIHYPREILADRVVFGPACGPSRVCDRGKSEALRSIASRL